jgi:hypothetical protein
MRLTRRQLIGSAAGLAAANSPAVHQTNPSEKPWHQRLRRVGQVNFNEKDPVELDIEAWASYWASARVDAVLINVTGMLAFYPTHVPFHRRSAYLGERVSSGIAAAQPNRGGCA